MRALERFLIAFAVIAMGMRFFHAPTAPVFLLLGLPALALYYITVFPFLKFASNRTLAPTGLRGRIAGGILSGIAMAYALIGLMAYTLGWIQRGDILGTACLALILLLVAHGIAYWRNKSVFSLQALVRAAVLLAVILTAAVALPSVSS